MAGDKILPIQEAPDVSENITLMFNDLTASEFVSNAEFFLYYAEKDTVIEECFVMYETVDTNADLTLKIKSGNNIATVLADDGGSDIWQAGPAVYKFTMDTEENIVPAGETLVMRFAAAASFDYLCIQMRVRRKLR
jgi:hypothetical protein